MIEVQWRDSAVLTALAWLAPGDAGLNLRIYMVAPLANVHFDLAVTVLRAWQAILPW